MKPTKATRLSGCLNDTIWRNKYLWHETKLRSYKSVIRPVLTYEAETRVDTSKTKQVLETREMNTSRKIIRKTNLDHVSNQDIKQQCGIQPIGECVNKRMEEWNKYISRMTEDRIVRIVR
jgi:hypothetical protein